ncbi:MAG: M23 family peptidase [Chloroflexi bacterium]|nr:MAG: M23 family peptidase [Chloroflexota bacterium]MBL1194470.1 M23 family metallopeptidase [Chloroflexota bacterium]NOH11758.1 M23 family metallopeptidase [Chloroflexota bacterium]
MFPNKKILFLLILVLLAACSPAPEATPTQLPTDVPTVAPTATPLPPPTETTIPTPEATATPEPLPVSEVCTPLRDHEIARLPEYVTNPYTETLTSNKEQGHHGVDFAYLYKDGDGPVIEGVDILSIMDGVVVSFTNNREPYGNMIMIETPYDLLPPEVIAFYEVQPSQSIYHLYAHLLDNPTLAMGQAVNCGDTLGQVGNTGNSGNPHLHLETRVGPGGQSFPQQLVFYDTTASPEQAAGYQRWRSSGEFVQYDPMLLFALVSPETEQ